MYQADNTDSAFQTQQHAVWLAYWRASDALEAAYLDAPPAVSRRDVYQFLVEEEKNGAVPPVLAEMRVATRNALSMGLPVEGYWGRFL